ncbi:hypothetical protein Plim_0984 [Planctopirus limnophila DSM 3776]|uniref:Uncharacterized protein n=1 Tax=Planctopirus limnophila (strain ATCC 43296 / DSM 3776 / IFAM 1008 / Mu 290) TaxID=521674 RepID=D5ST60_PLAL2|nr:hypothetical protein [Planctopirus limnophila]ADG66828.1 hypothetical protein Plim_0984 [Planctopirus limnophila DSM 3776]
MTPPAAPQISSQPDWLNNRTDTWQAAIKLEQVARREVVDQIQQARTRRVQQTIVLFLAAVGLISAVVWLDTNAAVKANTASKTQAVLPSTAANQAVAPSANTEAMLTRPVHTEPRVTSSVTTAVGTSAVGISAQAGLSMDPSALTAH